MATLPTATALAARCVHIKVYPTPRSLPERRQVLRVLERFGDVDMFRSLRVCAVLPRLTDCGKALTRVLP